MKAKKTAQLESTTADRISLTLYKRDTAAIRRLRAGLFEDCEALASTSELIRFLLRSAPDRLDAKRFLACREEMAEEDGRTKAGK